MQINQRKYENNRGGAFASDGNLVELFESSLTLTDIE